MLCNLLPLALALATPAAPAPTPAAADTTHYTVLNHGREAGEMTVAADRDTVTVHYRHVDRNRGNRSITRYYLTPDGTVRWGEMRPVGLVDGTVGDPQVSFEVAQDSVRWISRGGRGAGARDAGYYFLRGTIFDQALLARHLLGTPNSSSALLPAGNARVEIAADTVVSTASGSTRVRLAMLHLGSRTPSAVWLDDRGDLFAGGVGWFITVRSGAESTLPVLRELELRYRNAQGEQLARELMPADVPHVAIVNGNLFDADAGELRENTTVLVRGDRIVAVGPAASVTVPPDATIVDATGRTVIPGMWDMHVHLQHTAQSNSGLQQVARGITTVRDLAADTDVAVSYRDRAAAGRILGPRAILGGIVEGPGDWAGPTDVLPRTEAEARAVVAAYDSLGYRQIKLYNLVHPDLVPTIARETERRGMILSGHVPRGLSTPAAVRLGFNEINHAAFLFSTFYPDSIWIPTMRAYSAVALEMAPYVDVEGEEMTAMIELFRERGTIIDGTFSIWMRQGGAAQVAPGAGSGQDDALAARATANWLRLIQRLYESGVTMVPGTDAQGSSTFVAELEAYESAGVPRAHVLQMATIISARVMGDEADYGSIVPGKVADLVLIEGNPLERISDLRNVERVVLAGRVYDPEVLMVALRE